MKLCRLNQILDDLAPLQYAEDWDNTGLLLNPLETRDIQRILLTIDLSESVADEAVAHHIDAIISYHPILFRPIQRLNAQSPADRTLMKLINHNIAVYSPHTALDAAPGGTNDWLAQSVGPGNVSILAPRADNPAYGQGRRVDLDQPAQATEIIERIKKHLQLENVRLAGDPEKIIYSVALCAGAGASVISGINADLYLSGEMGHHDVLAAVQQGRCVVLCEHTNTERGYLQVLKDTLLTSADVEIILSQTDCDPLSVH